MNIIEDNKIIITTIIILLCTILIFSVDFPLLYLINENKNYVFTSKAIGYSMQPTIQNGDILVILSKNSPCFNPRVGDILIYSKDDTLIGHRIISIRNNEYLVKGDYNTGFDTLVSKQQVVGVVIGIAPRNPLGRWVTESFTNIVT